MAEGPRPGLTLPEAARAGDRCNKASWRYCYDDFQDLVAVSSPATDRYPQGVTTCFEYSSAAYTGELQHNLRRVIDAAGRVYLENEYGDAPGTLGYNRVVRQRQG